MTEIRRKLLVAHVLGVRVDIHGDEATLRALDTHCTELLGTPFDERMEIRARLDLEPRASAQKALAELTAVAVRTTPLLGIHAAVVSGPAGLIAVPGQRGLGKTTLAAALLGAGFGYVSDEVLALDRDTLAVTPFPRPLALAAGSWPVLGLDPTSMPVRGAEKLLDPATLGKVDNHPGRVCDIVLAQRARGPARLEPSERGPAVPALLTRAFNHFADPRLSFHAVVDLVRHARIWQANYADAPELAALLSAELN